MDEAQRPMRDGPIFAVDATIPGFSLEESRRGLSSGLYLDESLEKGLGTYDASSILYYGLNFDSGGLDLSAFREGEEDSKVRNLEKIPSEVGAAVDLFSASGLSNAYEDFSCEYDFSKKFPDLDYQFCEESNSWNSSLVSHSSGSSSKAVGAIKLCNQILECQDNQPEELISCELDGSYMTSFVWDMLMNEEMGVKSSYSNEPSYNNDVKTIASPVDTSESCHCSNEGYVGTSHDFNHLTTSGTSFSLSMQLYDDTIVDEGIEADNPSLQPGSLIKHIYSSDLQDFSQVSPMDTSESENHCAEGKFGTSYSTNHLAARHTTLSEQCGDAYLVEENSNADDPSLLGLLLNNPAYSCFPQEFTEVSPMDTTESFPCSNEGYIYAGHDLIDSKEGYTGASHDFKHLSPSCTSLPIQCCSAGIVDEDAEADDPSPAIQGVLIRNPVRSCDPHHIGEVKNTDRPVEISESGESYHPTNQEYFGTGLELNHIGPLGTSLPMQYSDLSLEDKGTEAEPITLQGAAAIRASDTCDLQDIGQVNIVVYPMKTRKFYHRRNKGNCGSSIDPNPGASSFTSMFMKYRDANLVDGETEAVGPSLQGLINSKPAELCDPHGIDEHNIVASSVDAGEAHQYKINRCAATLNDLDLTSQGISCHPICEQGRVASPTVNQTEEDDPTLQSILIGERAKCRKVRQCVRRKKVQKQPILRCSNDSPTLKISCERRTKEESVKSSKRNHIELQKKRQPKRCGDTDSAAHRVVSRNFSKEDLDSESSDDEYDPFQSDLKTERSMMGSAGRNKNKPRTFCESNLKTERSMKRSAGRKNNKPRTFCESNLKIENPKQSDGRKNNNLWTLPEVIKLVDAVSEFGVGSWTPIQQAHFRSPPYRKPLDIRDKWRNIIKTSAERLKQGKLSRMNCSINMPRSLMERIFELDRAHPYHRCKGKRW